MNQDKLLKARELRALIERIFDLDITINNRSRKRVDARMIYSNILREQKYTYKQIGYLLAKDHSTIVHYCLKFQEAIKYVPEFKRKYKICRDRFLGEISEQDDYTKQEIIQELLLTKKELSLLTLKYQKLQDYKNKKDMEELQWGKIYKLIHERSPRGMEDIVERRINAMFNTTYDYQKI